MRKKSYLAMLLLASCIMTACGGDEAANETKETSGKQQESTTDEAETQKKPQSVGVDLDTITTGISDDFLYGCDVSTLIAQENSGVKYYNENGEEQDALLTLSENGVNMIRVRVWNDPYDENGKGYGGGNCDTENAIAIGKRATEYGMTCMIDYHYSDFWSDPSKQMCPKEWKSMSIDEKSEALYQYTKESLGKILEAGIDVSIVQIGNETTSGMSGETNWDNIAKLMNSGSKAIRELSDEYDKDIKIAVHFTNPEKTGKYAGFAKTLNDKKVDYDIFASSYYPFWHGTLSNLENVLGQIVEKYGKEVMVAEISYAYTWDDGDGHQNTIYEGAWGTFDYELSTDSQIKVVKDCVETLANLGEYAVGICYWEPAWIPVPSESGDRLSVWEEYGSGWASSYAAGYDPKDAGQYYGGSAWDNQAWFDFEGKPLDSINTYEQIQNEN